MSKNILDLNDDCLAIVFKSLPLESHMGFAMGCVRLRHIWLDYRKSLYKRLELGNTTTIEGFKQEILLLRQISGHVKHLILNVSRHFEWKGMHLTEIINILETMTAVERVILWIKDSEPYEIFERIIQVLEKLPNIQGIATYQDNDVVDSVFHFLKCEHLLMESKMSRNPLIDHTNLHTKIRILMFNNASIYPTLADLVRHSAGVKELSFRMADKAAEYIPLTKLSKLYKLQIFGNCLTDDYGPLMPLVAAVSCNLSQQLRCLTIHASGLGYAETREISRIKTLIRLDCYFDDCQCLELLVDLVELRDLFVQLPDSNNIDSLLLKLLQNCRNLSVLQIKSPNLSSNFISEAYKVLETVRDPTKQIPLILMFGNVVFELDNEMKRYLKVFWQRD